MFERKGALLRQVNHSYNATYDRLNASGLYRSLIGKGLLIAHSEVDAAPFDPTTAARVIQPDLVPFVSYPYEWCFSQLKAAALQTIAIQRCALDSDFSLKDASAFNIQFVDGKPILIDSLSFEEYEAGKPWVAYRQFCRHFLGPLALMSLVDPRNTFSRCDLDGPPLDLTSRLLPWRTWLDPRLLIHLHWHARAQKSYGSRATNARAGVFSRQALLGLLDSLENAVQNLRWASAQSEWAGYYSETNYSDTATAQKMELVASFLLATQPSSVWDFGANTGRYSRLAAESGARTVAFDIDPACVDRHYRAIMANDQRRLLPLVLDLANPSPALGWDHSERDSLLDRGPVDLVMALALVHHLAIVNNLPLRRIASFFRRAGRHLIVEFVPKSDSQTQRLLAGRTDIFAEYSQGHFEAAFSEYFTIVRVEPILDSDRTLYLMRARTE